MYAINRPEVMIPIAADKFDSQSNLTDKFTEDRIRESIAAQTSWTIRYQTMTQLTMAAWCLPFKMPK